MNTKRWTAANATITAAAAFLAASGMAHAQTTPCRGSIGPDVIVGDLTGPANYNVDTVKGFDAFSIGTTSCNQGQSNLNWYTSSNTNDPNLYNDHPVIGGALFKYKNGRFEQLGFSWLKHGFYALSQTLCCTNCSATNGSTLGVGCSDPYTASRNGTQGNLGPRWQVNAATGAYPYPPANPSYTGNAARRVQVPLTSLEASSASVWYFAEAVYISPDDSAAGNSRNNASYRRVIMADSGGASGRFNAAFSGTTVREQPAIFGWKVADPLVQLVPVDVPQDGRFWVGSRVTDLGGGQWRYEYAIYNLTSDRSGASFSIPVPEGVTITNAGFKDVHYFDGDGIPTNLASPNTTSRNYDPTDWTIALNDSSTDSSVTWTVPHSFAANTNANALRWGTLYNFWFTANVAPEANRGNATLGLFKPLAGQPDAVTVANTDVPSAPPCPACAADFDNDGGVTPADITEFFSAFEAGARCGDVDQDGGITPADVGAFFASFEAGGC